MVDIKLKPAEEYSDGELLYLLMTGTDGANFEARYDQGLYQKYCNGETEEFSETTKLEMKCLDMLLKLGYPYDELGTYLYKSLIAKMYMDLERLDEKEFIQKSKDLLVLYADPFSKPYFKISRLDRDLGVKKFHLYINNVLKKIDYSKTDPVLSFNIYDGLPEELSVSENAYAIATYMLGKRYVPHKAKMPYVKTLYNGDK